LCQETLVVELVHSGIYKGVLNITILIYLNTSPGIKSPCGFVVVFTVGGGASDLFGGLIVGVYGIGLHRGKEWNWK